MKNALSRYPLSSLLLIVSVLLVTGCGAQAKTAVSPPATLPPPGTLTGDADRGASLYQRPVLGSNGAPGCITCHSLAPGITLVGPSHAGLAARAETAVPGQPAALYLWNSIIDPNAHITSDFDPGAMYEQYATELSGQEIADLVAYMMTLTE